MVWSAFLNKFLSSQIFKGNLFLVDPLISSNHALIPYIMLQHNVSVVIIIELLTTYMLIYLTYFLKSVHQKYKARELIELPILLTTWKRIINVISFFRIKYKLIRHFIWSKWHFFCGEISHTYVVLTEFLFKFQKRILLKIKFFFLRIIIIFFFSIAPLNK